MSWGNVQRKVIVAADVDADSDVVRVFGSSYQWARIRSVDRTANGAVWLRLEAAACLEIREHEFVGMDHFYQHWPRGSSAEPPNFFIAALGHSEQRAFRCLAFPLITESRLEKPMEPVEQFRNLDRVPNDRRTCREGEQEHRSRRQKATNLRS